MWPAQAWPSELLSHAVNPCSNPCSSPCSSPAQELHPTWGSPQPLHLSGHSLGVSCFPPGCWNPSPPKPRQWENLEWWPSLAFLVFLHRWGPGRALENNYTPRPVDALFSNPSVTSFGELAQAGIRKCFANTQFPPAAQPEQPGQAGTAPVLCSLWCSSPVLEKIENSGAKTGPCLELQGQTDIAVPGEAGQCLGGQCHPVPEQPGGTAVVTTLKPGVSQNFIKLLT